MRWIDVGEMRAHLRDTSMGAVAVVGIDQSEPLPPGANRYTVTVFGQRLQSRHATIDGAKRAAEAQLGKVLSQALTALALVQAR